jgi:hypothetical protein
MTDEPKSLQEAEELLRRRPTPRRDDLHLPSPQAVALWRELRSWDGKCTCPPKPPWRGPAFVNGYPVGCDPRQYDAEQTAYKEGCARCVACRERRRLEPELIRALGLKLKPWQMEIDDFPDVVAALDEAGAGNGSARPTPNRD